MVQKASGKHFVAGVASCSVKEVVKMKTENRRAFSFVCVLFVLILISSSCVHSSVNPRLLDLVVAVEKMERSSRGQRIVEELNQEEKERPLVLGVFFLFYWEQVQ